MLLRPLPTDELASWRSATHDHLVNVQTAANTYGREDAEARAGQLLDQAVVDGVLAAAHEVWQVCDDNDVVGSVWVAAVHDDPSTGRLMSLRIDPAAVPHVWRLLQSAYADRWKALSFTAFRGDDVMAALVDTSHPTLIATGMQSRVDDAIEAVAHVDLRPMTPPRFREFIEHSVEHYAAEILAAGAFATAESAHANAVESFEQLLPGGLQTPGQLVWSAYDGGHEVGILWVALKADRGFIYDIEVGEQFRRRGYATAILAAGAREVRTSGHEYLDLNVWGPNTGAKSVYDRAGYITTVESFQASLGGH